MKQREQRHPIQPLYVCETDGLLRFKPNAIVRYLLDNGGIDMNQIACLDFSQDDRAQFAQLIGYSHRGFGTLSYASDRIYNEAERRFDRRLARTEKAEGTT